jgi:hydroxymethylpyrimidine pyrophosphatase-like HAD family hydrolase
MRYVVLACDYDGTIAHHGVVEAETLAALEDLRRSGRRLVLVTGRELEDLFDVFQRVDIFDRVVAENGAVLYDPAGRELTVLASPPPPELVRFLEEREIEPLSVGHVIIATWEPHQALALEAVRQLGLEIQVIFNKGAVMLLPSGVNKRSGLAAALESLDLSAHNAVGVGDAENDHAFLECCELSVAVANAVPALKDTADLVTEGERGAGVAELARRLLECDLEDVDAELPRHRVLLGCDAEGAEVGIVPARSSLLVAGPSGSGKSTLTTGLVERLSERGYQFCILDPEGDYEDVAGAVPLGDATRAPSCEEIIALLQEPTRSAVVNLLGVRLGDRPGFFAQLYPRLAQLRATLGHPHCILVDEAHHMIPEGFAIAPETLPTEAGGLVLVTVHPERIAPAALRTVGVAAAVGDDPGATLAELAGAVDEQPPSEAPATLEPGEALLWFRRNGGGTARIKIAVGAAERNRHRRKYAEGELGRDKSFYFRGPDGRLNLRAQNLIMFLQLAEGVDDETWLHHLRGGDYSSWIRDSVKDEELAGDVADVEERRELDTVESRDLVRQAIEERYTLSE